MGIGLEARHRHCMRRMVSMASDTVGSNFPGRTVAGHAISFNGHEHIGGFAARSGSVTSAAIDGLGSNRIDLMFGVVKTRLRHPTINQNWLGQSRDRYRICLHVMAQGATYIIGTRGSGGITLWPIRVFLEEDRLF